MLAGAGAEAEDSAFTKGQQSSTVMCVRRQQLSVGRSNLSKTGAAFLHVELGIWSNLY